MHTCVNPPMLPWIVLSANLFLVCFNAWMLRTISRMQKQLRKDLHSPTL